MKKSLTLALAAVVLGCAGSDASDAPRAKSVLMSSATEAVVVLPLNVTAPMPASLKSAGPGLWEEVRGYIEAHGASLKTVAFPAAQGLWLASVREARAEAREAGFPEAARIFVAKLAGLSEFEAVVVPSLFVQGALVSGRTASWDGVEHRLAIDEGSWAGRLDEATDFGGAVPAVSLHAVVLDARGRVIHERQAGLALLASIRLTGRPELRRPGFEVVELSDPFTDRDAVLEGIARALDPYLTPLAPAAIPRR